MGMHLFCQMRNSRSEVGHDARGSVVARGHRDTILVQGIDNRSNVADSK